METDLRRWMRLCEAITAYHGSSEGEPVFAASHTGNNSHTFGSYQSTRHGIFFTDNPQFAALYGKVTRYRLNLRHTLDLENDNNTVWDFVQSLDPHSPERDLWLTAREIMFRDKYWQLFEDEVGERFVPFLQQRGYDSATFTEYHDENGEEFKSKTIVVFDPRLITLIRK